MQKKLAVIKLESTCKTENILSDIYGNKLTIYDNTRKLTKSYKTNKGSFALSLGTHI